MKHYFFLLLNLLISSLSIAQHGYQEGFVLVTAEDTIYGLIENRSYYQNSINCNFKKVIDDTVTHFSPNEVFGFRFNEGKYYISKEFENQRYFFEYLINGELNVYSKQDRDLSNHYFIEKDTLPFKELEFKSQITLDKDGIQRLTKSKTHNLLLSYYTSDYPQLKEAAMNIDEPNSSSLIKFAKDYHNAICKNQSCIIYEKKTKLLMELEINGGISHIFIDTTSYIPEKTFATGGFMVNLMIPKISESIYFGLGLSYYQYPERILIEKKLLYTTLYGDSIFKWTYETKYKPHIQLPIAVFYNNHRPGLSPIFGLSTNILYFFDFKALCGVNYQKDLLAIKLYGEYSMFPAVNSYLKSVGIKIGISYLIK